MGVPPTIQAHELVELLRSWRFAVMNEAELQWAIGKLLTEARVAFIREFSLGRRDRVDFFLTANGIAVECKCKGGYTEVVRQLHRYAEHEVVKEIVLVTKFMRHDMIPDRMCEKPVHICVLPGAFA